MSHTRRELRLDAGLAQAEDTRTSGLGTLRALSGARITRAGRIEKRRGMVEVDLTAAPGGTLTAFQVAEFQGAPVLLASLGESYPTGLWYLDSDTGEWLPAHGGDGSAYGLPLVTGIEERQPQLAAGEPTNPKVALAGDVLCVAATMSREDSALSLRDVLEVQLYRVTATGLIPLRAEQLDFPRVEFGVDLVSTGSGFIVASSRPGSGPPGIIDAYTLSEASPLTLAASWNVVTGGTIGRFALAWDGGVGIGVATGLGNTASFWAFNAFGGRGPVSTRVLTNTLRNVTIAKRGALFACAIERRISASLFVVEGVVGSAASSVVAPTISLAGTDLLGTGGAGSSISVDNDRSPVGIAMLPSGAAGEVHAALAIERVGATGTPEVLLYRMLAATATTTPALVGVTSGGSGGGSRLNSARLDGHPVVATTATVADPELALDEVLVPVVRGEAPGDAWQLWAPGPLRDTIDAHLDELSASRQFGDLGPVSRGVRLSNGRVLFARLRLDDLDRPGLALTEVECYGAGYSLAEADGQLLLTSGALTLAWDGRTLSELGWLGRPVLDDVSAAASGSLTNGEAYTMVACWAMVDSRGRVHRSAPSNPISWTNSGTVGRIVRGTLPSTWRSRRRSAGEPRPTIALEFYRSIGDGAVLFFDAAAVVLPDDSAPADGRFVVHTTTQSDAALSGAVAFETRPRTLYTQSRGVELGAPLPASLSAFGDGRLMVASGRTYQVSFPLEPGEPLAFPGPASALSANFRGEAPEPILALASLDERFYLFGERGVYVVTGAAPDRNGNGAYNAPVRLPSAGGSDNPESLAEVPDGLLANLSGRLSLLPRGNAAPVWHGERARDAFDGRRAVAALSRRAAWETVFALDDGSSLAYDVRADAWTMGAFPASPALVSLAEVGTQLWGVGADGTAWAESSSVVTDPAATIVLRLNPVPLAGVLGWGNAGELALLGAYQGDCVVTARYTTNDFRTLSPLGGTGARVVAAPEFSAGDPVVLHWTPPIDGAQRMGFELEVAIGAGSDGVWLSAIGLEAEPINGRARGRASQDG